MLYPDIVRATALSLLSGYPVKESFAAIESGLSDPDALVRQTAISTINLLQFDKDAKLIFPLLYDPVKAVRIQAALGVASMQNLKLTTDQQTVFDSGIKEYVSAMEYAGDFASGRYNLALMYHAQQQAEQAIENYEQAIRIDSLFIPAMNNLAMLYNARGENENAEKLLKKIIDNRPDMHEISYSLGLLLVEEKKYDQAAIYLQMAADALPGRSRIHYNLGLLLQFLKKEKKAERALLRALAIEPGNFEFLFALADHYIKRKMPNNAISVANKMIEFFPNDKTGYDMLRYAMRMTRQLNMDGIPQPPMTEKRW